MSLRQVERVTGISNAYLSQLENGRTINPSPRLLEKLADAFDAPYSDLMSAAGYLPDVLLPRRTAFEVSHLTNELNLDERREVESFIENLIARRQKQPGD
jgi:HTH-type transcriptional regulator, competence development regulator